MAEERTSDSGGSMVLLTDPPADVTPDLSLLEPLRLVPYDDELRAAGTSPYFDVGDVITWHYAQWVDVMRVVRDDERGLVAWLPAGSERVVGVAEDGRGLRDRPVAERGLVPRIYRTTRWTGPGILRIAPTGVPWSLWYFYDADGTFAGHYLNLELTHERPVDGTRRTHSRDLVLDLWLEDGQVWLKDADELAASVDAGKFTAEQGEVVRALADVVRRELVDPRAWPLDEGWESWRPPAGWDEPLDLPSYARP